MNPTNPVHAPAETSPAGNPYRFDLLFHQAPLPMALWDREGRLLCCNARFVSILGYPAEEILNLDHWYELVLPDAEYRRLARSSFRRP